MGKILIWGTGNIATHCVEDLMEDVEIVAFVQSKVTSDTFFEKKVIMGEQISQYQHDYLVLANSFEKDILEEFNLEGENIVFYRQRQKDVSIELFKSHQTEYFYNKAREVMPYLSVECDDLTFLFNKTDMVIPEHMIMNRETWEKQTMEFFMNTCPDDKKKGYFLDIGANIGTTSIFIHNNINSEYQFIAFEPLRENYKLLKANCILNDCEDIIVENQGVSNEDGIKGMKIVTSNYGGSGVTHDVSKYDEINNFVKIDTYVEEKNIAPEEIAYIWMDIEGHESYAIEGAKETLQKSNAPLCVEWNIESYRRQERYDTILKDMKEIYHYFFCMEQYMCGKKDKRKIAELDLLAEEMEYKSCNVLFMK